MGVNISPSEYEARADQLRAEIGATVDALRSRLAPSSIASEAAARVGLADLSWGGAFDYATKRHPIPTAVIAVGVAFWTLSALRRQGRGGAALGLTEMMRESSESIVDSATRVLRKRAEAKRRQFVDIAQSQVETGAEFLSDQIEKGLETYIGRAPVGMQVRPLIESSVQLALAAALEALVRRHSRLYNP